MILKDGRLDVLPEEREKEPVEARKEPAEVRTPHMAIEIVDKPVDKEMPVQPQERICTVPEKEGLQSESREEKAKRLQWILQQLIREAVRENNPGPLPGSSRKSMVKELDYQFRSRERTGRGERPQTGTAQRGVLSEDGRAVAEKDQGTTAETAERGEKAESGKESTEIADKENNRGKLRQQKKKRHFIF